MKILLSCMTIITLAACTNLKITQTTLRGNVCEAKVPTITAVPLADLVKIKSDLENYRRLDHTIREYLSLAETIFKDPVFADIEDTDTACMMFLSLLNCPSDVDEVNNQILSELERKYDCRYTEKPSLSVELVVQELIDDAARWNTVPIRLIVILRNSSDVSVFANGIDLTLSPVINSVLHNTPPIVYGEVKDVRDNLVLGTPGPWTDESFGGIELTASMRDNKIIYIIPLEWAVPPRSVQVFDIILYRSAELLVDMGRITVNYSNDYLAESSNFEITEQKKCIRLQVPKDGVFVDRWFCPEDL
ncbi:hypothetical protein [Vibrio parahaemolyticus]|uniref:hypothetical protein n=1 Tax=Vibrio parahaemolyticus TaxID=670 RepID=UPI001121EE07|nr:hypothetical protein [Vibrio parahaemolyticus]